MFKGKNIKLSSRDEFSGFINLFNLGVSNNIDPDSFFIDTLVVQVDFERDNLFSLPITGKVSELASIRRSILFLRHHVQGSGSFISLSNPQLRTQERPEVISFKGDLKDAIIDFHTDTSSFHGLAISIGDDGMAFSVSSRLQLDLRVNADFVRRRLVNTVTITVNLEVKPSHPSLSVSDSVFVRKGLGFGRTHEFARRICLLDFSVGNHGVLHIADTVGKIERNSHGPGLISSRVTDEVVKGFEVWRSIAELGHRVDVFSEPELVGNELPVAGSLKGHLEFRGIVDKLKADGSNLLRGIIRLSIERVALLSGLIRRGDAHIGGLWRDRHLHALLSRHTCQREQKEGRNRLDHDSCCFCFGRVVYLNWHAIYLF